MDYKQKAQEYFGNGFNCAQSVLAPFAEELGISEELALKVASSFGGGARCGQLCGAVSGALMALGLKHGHYHTSDMEEKAKAGARAIEFNKRFCERNGFVVCKELLGNDPSVPEQHEILKEQGLFQTVCPKLVCDATEIVEEMIFKGE